MRVLITGGAGFIGSHTADLAVAAGHDVLVLDNLSTGSLANLEGPARAAEVARVDIRDDVALRAVVGRWQPEVVVHLAAIASVTASIAEPGMVYGVNVTGTQQVLEAARLVEVRRFVFASSAAVYGGSPQLPSRESDALDPVSPYAAHKAAGELLLHAYRQSFGMETVALRFFNVFGERQRADSPYSGVISIFVAALLAQGYATITGDGEQTRDFVAVADVARAVLAAATDADPGAGAINVGRGASITIRELYRTLASLLSLPDEPRFGPARPGDVRHSLAEVARLRERLGFTPRVSLAAGLAGLVAGAGAESLPLSA